MLQWLPLEGSCHSNNTTTQDRNKAGKTVNKSHRYCYTGIYSRAWCVWSNDWISCLLWMRDDDCFCWSWWKIIGASEILRKSLTGLLLLTMTVERWSRSYMCILLTWKKGGCEQIVSSNICNTFICNICIGWKVNRYIFLHWMNMPAAPHVAVNVGCVQMAILHASTASRVALMLVM